MENVKYVTLNGFDFIITKEVVFNNTKYMLAIDEKGEDSILLLKTIIDGGKEKVESVTDEEEFEVVMSLIAKENINNN